MQSLVTTLVIFTAQWLLLLPAGLVGFAVLVRKRWTQDIAEGAAAGLMTIVFVKIAGALVHERRPFIVEHVQPLIPHAADNAFPSDHLAACGLAVVYLWPRSKPLAIISFGAACAIAVARVDARLHWPLDVIVGFVLGAAAAALAHALATRFRVSP